MLHVITEAVHDYQCITAAGPLAFENETRCMILLL